MPKKLIQPDEKVPLKLTIAQRKIVLEDLLCLEQDLEEAIRTTPAGKPVMMTLDDLDDFCGHVAAEANHCDDAKKRRILDAVFLKIQKLLEKHSDQEPPNTLKIEDARQAKIVSGVLYQIKIILLGSKPAIWRRIQVEDCTLDELHEHIQTAMGWTNSHLHQFEINGQQYGDPELMDDGFDEFKGTDSTRSMISDIVPTDSKRFAFKYKYDFGDDWEHEVVFEGCPPIEKRKKYPICLEGERACPPEDVGGIWGYQDFLTAIANAKHEEHESFLFSADAFDPKQATREMKKGLPDWRRM